MDFFKINIFFIKILILVIMFSCTLKKRVWTVVTAELPDKLLTSQAFDRPVAYVLKQTHEPLFELSGNGEYKSLILEKWDRNNDYSQFNLCPKSNIAFNSKLNFTPEYLKEYLSKRLPSLYKTKFKISRNDKCVKLTFDKSVQRFLFDFSFLDNAPTLSIPGSPREVGLGDFSVEKWSKDEIILKRKTSQFLGIDEIVFYNYDFYQNLPNKKLIIVNDANTLNYSQKKMILGDETSDTEYRLNSMNTMVLLINLDNVEVRDQIVKCTDLLSLAQGLFPMGELNKLSGSIIPLGMPGSATFNSSKGLACSNLKKLSNVKLNFSTWNSADENKIAESFSRLISKTNIKINVQKMSYNKLSKLINAGTFDLMAISIDTTNLGYKYIFISLFDPKEGLFKKPAPIFLQDLENFKTTYSLDEERLLGESLQKKIQEQNWVLPIGPTSQILRLSKKFSNIEYNDDFLLFPKISKIRARPW